MKKYKPCYERRCLVYGCKSQEQGACYCICRLIDRIGTLQDIIDGSMIKDGAACIYIPDEQRRRVHIEKMTNERRKEYEDFRLNEAPELLKKHQEKLKTYEI